MTALDGDAEVAGIKADVDAGFDDIWDNLNIAGMLLVDAQKGPWVASLNMVGARVESGSSSHDLDVTADVAEVGAALAYELVDREVGRSASGVPLSFRLAPLAGARFSYVRAEIDSGAGPSADRSESWVDPLIGVRGSFDITERWRIAAEADIGGFGVGSDLAWNAQAFLAYRTSFLGAPTDLAIGYRALGEDYDRNNFKYDVTMHGPVVGVAFNF